MIKLPTFKKRKVGCFSFTYSYTLNKKCFHKLHINKNKMISQLQNYSVFNPIGSIEQTNSTKWSKKGWICEFAQHIDVASRCVTHSAHYKI